MEQGLSYYKAEQYADAIAAFDRLIQLTPDYTGAYFNKGNALSDSVVLAFPCGECDLKSNQKY
jgi:tetratricopeptide (TPR) repeat protein